MRRLLYRDAYGHGTRIASHKLFVGVVWRY